MAPALFLADLSCVEEERPAGNAFQNNLLDKSSAGLDCGDVVRGDVDGAYGSRRLPLK